jgi:hypothetical protein
MKQERGIQIKVEKREEIEERNGSKENQHLAETTREESAKRSSL